jgi:hypothetical protein
MNRRSVSAVLAAASLVAGCGTGAGSFGPAGYRQTTYGYQVKYAWPKEQLILDREWQLDNLRLDKASGTMAEKRGPDYVSVRLFDEDGDGEIAPSEMHKEATFDLRFVNARDGGMIWIKAHPLAMAEAARDLDVLFDRYVENLSGSGIYWSTNVFSVGRQEAKHFVAFVTRRGPTRVGPNLAIWSFIELAESERLRLDRSHRSSRVEVVISKLPYVHCRRTDSSGPASQTAQPPGAPCQQRPALLVAGYVNDIAHFDAHVADFHRFLSQVTLDASSTLPLAWQSRPVTPVPPSSTPAATAAAPGQP